MYQTPPMIHGADFAQMYSMILGLVGGKAFLENSVCCLTLEFYVWFSLWTTLFVPQTQSVIPYAVILHASRFLKQNCMSRHWPVAGLPY